MPQIIQRGKELIRINTQKNSIEYSTSGGRSWSSRYTGSSCGTFNQLSFDGKYLLATTSKGLYYSSSGGRSWSKR